MMIKKVMNGIFILISVSNSNKNLVKTLYPSSEILKSFNLKPGKNTIKYIV